MLNSNEIIHNETIDSLLARRSVRAYKPEQISEKELDTLLYCAFNAPSGANRQQWYLSVVQDKALLADMAARLSANALKNPELPENMKERYSSPDFSICFKAPTVIFVAYPTSDGAVNASFLAENLIIAAHSIGIGSCFLGGMMHYFNSPEAADIIKRLNLPEGYTVAYGLSIGYPAESPDAKPRDLTKFIRV